jgi:hypothetical protein
MSTTLQRFHEQVILDTFDRRLSDDDAVLVFALLHFCRIYIVPGSLENNPTCESIAAITQRHAGDVLASLWRGKDDARANYTYWYFKWQSTSFCGSYELAKLPERAFELKILLEHHPFVLELREED